MRAMCLEQSSVTGRVSLLKLALCNQLTVDVLFDIAMQHDAGGNLFSIASI